MRTEAAGMAVALVHKELSGLGHKARLARAASMLQPDERNRFPCLCEDPKEREGMWYNKILLHTCYKVMGSANRKHLRENLNKSPPVWVWAIVAAAVSPANNYPLFYLRCYCPG